MIRITLFEHPFVCAQPQVFEVHNLSAWLLEHYHPQPELKVQVFVGEPSAESEITDNLPALMAGDAPAYTVLQSPGGFDL